MNGSNLLSYGNRQTLVKGDQSLLKSSYADAAKSLAVVLAANESMKTGQAVKV